MLGLILDTSTERGVFAIADDKQSLFEVQLPFGLQSSHYLLPELAAQMEKHHLTSADLSYAACGTGPGSYTGIRVAATVAKAFAFTGGIPLIGVGTMDAFFPSKAGKFAVVIDAKIGGAYLQTGIMDEEGACKRSAPAVWPLAEAAALLQDVDLLLTPHAAVLRPKLEALSLAKKWEWHEMYPSASALAAAAKIKMRQGEYSADGFADSALELQYLRKTQAEIEKGRLHT